jgi:hypothetical protein
MPIRAASHAKDDACSDIELRFCSMRQRLTADHALR